MNKRQQILAEEMADFRASWQAAGGGWVSGRMLMVTGFMLRELEEAGMVEGNGRGEYRPR